MSEPLTESDAQWHVHAVGYLHFVEKLSHKDREGPPEDKDEKPYEVKVIGQIKEQEYQFEQL